MNNLQKPLLSGLVALTLSTPAYSQETRAAENKNRAQIFAPAYFEGFAPRTAIDMVSRIPGFQIQSSAGKRGLGQGGANILINGNRISGKTNAEDQLSRINATNVVRIEIVDGTSLDIPGLSGQVANVITKSTSVSGSWQWRPEWRNRLEANLYNFRATVSGETGDLAWSVTAKNDAFRGGARGPETLTLADGTIFETRYEDGQFYRDNPGVSTDLTWKPRKDHVGNLNLKYNQFNFNGREQSKRTAVTAIGSTGETLSSNAEDEWNASLDVDYEFPFLMRKKNGKLKLIGYYRFEHSPTISRFDVFDSVLGRTGGRRFSRVADEAEAIGRAEYSWKPNGESDWQLGVEGVFNYLDITSSLLVLDASGDFVDRPLTGATSRVEEKRGEATLTHSRKLSDKWDVQASVGAEYSEISQDTGFVRTFFRPKGFVSATYKPDDSTSIVTRIEREVGQLSFFDFISSVNLQEDLDSFGNLNLVPQQSWNGDIELNKNFGNGITLKATVFAKLISDLVDRIPIGVAGDAVGNIDSLAHQYGLNSTATIKGDKWGFEGTQLNLTLNWATSSVKDPIGGFDRLLNNEFRSLLRADFRHDIPNTDWAWGFFANQFWRGPTYRLTTVNQLTFDGPFGSAYIEHKDIFGLKIRAELANLFDAGPSFRREVYDNRRANLLRIEDRSRRFDLVYNMRVSGTF
ncbi:MAG: TonB-dependent receptor plug domain-containing protein [Robiginitomaculum sp.]|nr:TonB-dependent receptor plug domain-containing protein [Robiginitomaculum sp.]